MNRNLETIRQEMKKLEESFDRREISEDVFKMRFRNLEQEVEEMKKTLTMLPSFCKTMFIIDLVLCCIRALLVFLSIAGYMILKSQGSPLLHTVPFEILTGVIMAAFGIPANILLLKQKSSGIPLAYMDIVGTIGSCAVGIWQVTYQMPSDPVQAGPFMVGAAFTVIIRLGLIGLYVAALKKFSQWQEMGSSKEEMAKMFD